MGYMAFTLVVPTIVLAASRRRGPAPPAFVFPSDAVFVVVVALAAGFDLAASDRGRIVLLSILVAAVAHGLLRTRQELRELHVEPAPDAAEPATSLPSGRPSPEEGPPPTMASL